MIFAVVNTNFKYYLHRKLLLSLKNLKNLRQNNVTKIWRILLKNFYLHP